MSPLFLELYVSVKPSMIRKTLNVLKMKSQFSDFRNSTGSLTKNTLIKTTISISAVIVASTGIAYFQTVSRLSADTLTQVSKYVLLRAQREQTNFDLAQEQQSVLKKALLQRLQANSDRDFHASFEQQFTRMPDGTIRNRQRGFDPELIPGVFLGKNVEQNADMERRVVTYFDLLGDYGPAWRSRFVNTYMQIPENGIVIYMPSSPWAQNAPSDESFRVTADESFYITDRAHNRDRKTVWTGIYYDQVARAWMASCVTPVDVGGRHVATIGHDMLIDELRNRTVSDALEGTYNMIFREDGRLIAHPQLMEQIQQGQGKFDISQSNDGHLKHIFEVITQHASDQTIIDNPKYDEYLAVTKLNGPNWYFITVFPKSLLQKQAFASARIILFAGLISLLIEAIIIFLILHRQLSAPLSHLMKATESITEGNLDVELDSNRRDELGRLAYLFNHMAHQLRSSFAKLAQANEELELRVEERTIELKQAKETADSANKAKSEFLANMSHELRTPLNGILGYTQILQRSSLDRKEQQGIGIIHQCASHLLTLINDILDLAKIEARKMELDLKEVALSSLLQGVVEICRIRAEQKGVAFCYSPQAELPSFVSTDEKRLRQVLINLLSNAIKFTNAGTVTFKVSLVDDDRQNANPSQSYKIRFQIEDTGIGMHPEQLEKIFLPFEQVGSTDKQSEGTGLGLAISQKIVGMLGSSIQVESVAGVGSIFWFEVELAEAHMREQLEARLSANTIVGFKGDKRRILVVDDRWENRLVLKNLLEPIGFEIFEANNGQVGLAEAIRIQPDLTITDISMPEMDGYELLKQLRQLPEFADAILFVASASVYESDFHESIAAGANEFLPKPLQADRLFELLQQYLQLEWIHKTNFHQVTTTSQPEAGILEQDPTEMVLPSSQELSVLYDLARKGLVHNLLQQLEQLEQSDVALSPFCQSMQQLAKGFEMKKIRIFLEQHLESHV